MGFCGEEVLQIKACAGGFNIYNRNNINWDREDLDL